MRDRYTDEQLAAHAKANAANRKGHGPLARSDMFLIDLFDQLKWVEYAIYRSQGGKPRKPEPTPRPGVPAKGAKKTATVQPLNEDALNYLRLMRERRGG